MTLDKQRAMQSVKLAHTYPLLGTIGCCHRKVTPVCLSKAEEMGACPIGVNGSQLSLNLQINLVWPNLAVVQGSSCFNHLRTETPSLQSHFLCPIHRRTTGNPKLLY